MFSVDILIPFHRNDELVRASIQSAHLSLKVAVRVIAVNDTGLQISAGELGLKDSDLLVSTRNRGYLNAMRVAIESSAAEFVCFLDSDDLISKSKILEQIHYLTTNNLDFVSCDMAKIDVNGDKSKSRGVLGKIPLTSNPRSLWLIGTHGADSTLMCKGSILRTTWNTHSKFATHFADYGWALSLPDSVVIGHLPVAHYFYRSHPNQISRNVNLGESWSAIHELWKENLFRCFSSIDRGIKITDNVALALAFPAAITMLNREERKVLKEIISSIISEVREQEINDFKAWRTTLYRRGLIATRGLTFKYWREAIPLAILASVEFTNGKQFRRIRKG
jgi:glycosyltransferase involved in cell wall biosynthesis